MDAQLIRGDCRSELLALEAGCARLAYIDPPFFTQKVHRLASRDRRREFAFADLWSGHEEYAEFLHACLSGVWRALADDGSVVLHCDRRSAHIARWFLRRRRSCQTIAMATRRPSTSVGLEKPKSGPKSGRKPPPM